MSGTARKSSLIDAQTMAFDALVLAPVGSMAYFFLADRANDGLSKSDVAAKASSMIKSHFTRLGGKCTLSAAMLLQSKGLYDAPTHVPVIVVTVSETGTREKSVSTLPAPLKPDFKPGQKVIYSNVNEPGKIRNGQYLRHASNKRVIILTSSGEEKNIPLSRVKHSD